ncbi:MAG: PAC2 family protein [Micrococcales bacterium]
MFLANSFFSGRTLLVAFEGWHDAAETASGALKYIGEQLDVELVATVDPEDYYDFQFSRPMVTLDADGKRELTWPTAELLRPSRSVIAENPEFANIYLLVGNEPARRWKTFTDEIVEFIVDAEIDQVIFLGAQLADVPHTRPITISTTSQNETARNTLNLERSHYEGPVGIMSVLGMAFEKAGIPTIALWASVPHYVQNAPSPKATLSMLIEIERYLQVEFDHGSLADEAFTWERSIDELAEGDEDMAGYIEQLESTRDALDSEAAQGEALAQEFERFLKLEDDAAKPDEET